MWTTQVIWEDGQNRVVLRKDGVWVGKMTLDDWAALGATSFLVNDALEQAGSPPVAAGSTAAPCHG